MPLGFKLRNLSLVGLMIPHFALVILIEVLSLNVMDLRLELIIGLFKKKKIVHFIVQKMVLHHIFYDMMISWRIFLCNGTLLSIVMDLAIVIMPE
jgi:hypothetical protein